MSTDTQTAADTTKDTAAAETTDKDTTTAATDTGDKGADSDKSGDTADKTTDATGDKAGDETKTAEDAKDGKGKDETSLLGDEAAETDADGKPKPDAKDGADKKPAADWDAVRVRAIDREMKRLEGQLSKKLTAADLPKELAKQRKALENVLGRATSLEDALIAGYNAQQKIRSGQAKMALPEDATDEEKAEWRKQNDIPEKASEYSLEVQGHKWTDADKPLLGTLTDRLHKANAPQTIVTEVLGFYTEAVRAAQEARAEQLIEVDRNDVKAGRDLLRDHLGEGEYKPSIALMKRYLGDEEVFPDGLGDLLAGARFADGRKVINNPNIAKYLIENARGQYGDGALLSGNAAAAVTDEKSELEKLMNTDIDKYMNETWKNTGMTGSQRLYELNKKAEGRGRGKAA